MMRSSRSVLLSPPARWTTRRCWSGCGRTVSDPLLTQNTKKTGRSGRKQWKIRRANGGKKHKSEPKQLRFALETTYGPEGRGFESLTAYQRLPRSHDLGSLCLCVAVLWPKRGHRSQPSRRQRRGYPPSLGLLWISTSPGIFHK